MKEKFSNRTSGFSSQRILEIGLLLILVFTAILSARSLIRVQAEVDKNLITIGDRIQYKLTIEHQKGIRIEQPGPGANLGQFEIKDFEILDPVEENGLVRREYLYVISVFDTGTFVIPPFPVAFAASDTATRYQLIQSEPLEIRVESVLDDPNADIRDIKEPILLPLQWKRYAMWAAVVLLILVAIGLTIYFFYLRKKGQPIFRKEVVRPAHEIAREKLAALRQRLKEDLEAGRQKVWFSDLSETLRIYLEGRFFVRAMEETTAEILEAIAEAGIEPEEQERVRQILGISDLVKFASYQPTMEEAENALQLCEQFVENTRLEFEAVEHEVPVADSAEANQPEKSV
ncbi:MAG: hypothetical protein Kow0037_27360 [Calditrichia bacterium]